MKSWMMIPVALLVGGLVGALSVQKYAAVERGTPASRQSLEDELLESLGPPPDTQPDLTTMAAKPLTQPATDIAHEPVDGDWKFDEPTRQLRVLLSGNWPVIMTLPHGQTVYGCSLSPSGRQVLVWAGDPAGRKAMVYDLIGRGVTHTFNPPPQGTLRWASETTIFHQWTQWQPAERTRYAVYDLAGAALLQGGTSGMAFSPSGRYAVTFPASESADEPVCLLDLATGKTLWQSGANESPAVVLEWDWHAENELRMKVRLRNSDERVVTIDPTRPGHREFSD